MFRFVYRVEAPASVKQASWLMLSYALVVLVGALWFAWQTEFTHVKELFRGLLRFAGMTGLAFWLLTLDKKAWWFSIGACGFLAVLGIVGMAVLVFAGFADNDSLLWLILRILFPVYLLGHVTVILAKRGTRDAFH